MYQETKELSAPKVIEHPCLVGWRKRVDEAEQRGAFTGSEKELADLWNCCACGEAREAGFNWEREFGSAGAPTDPTLAALGYRFNDEVDEDHFTACRDTLTAIENRLAELARG